MSEQRISRRVFRRRAVRPELPELISMTPIEDLLDLGSRMGVGGRSDVGSPSEAQI